MTEKTGFIFLIVVFLSATSFVVTEMTVISMLATSSIQKTGLGAGSGIIFLGLGELVSLLLLAYLIAERRIKVVSYFIILGSLITFFFLFVSSGTLPIWLVAFIIGLVFCGFYVINDYLLNISVYNVSSAKEKEVTGKKMQVSFLSAQALVPIIVGYIYDNYHHNSLLVVIVICNIFICIFMLHFYGDQLLPPKESNIFQGIKLLPHEAKAILLISSIDIFILNWYFSTILTSLQGTISASMIGLSLSGISLSGICGATTIIILKPSADKSLKYLFNLVIVICCIIMSLHVYFGIESILVTFIAMILIGFFAGCSAALANSLKYTYVDKSEYLFFHQGLSVITIISTILGSSIGVSMVYISSASVSVMFGIVVTLLLGIGLSKYIFTAYNT